MVVLKAMQKHGQDRNKTLFTEFKDIEKGSLNEYIPSQQYYIFIKMYQVSTEEMIGDYWASAF